MLSKILKREWVTIMNNVFDISLNVLVDCVNEKKDFSLLIKEYTKNVKLNNYKKTCLSICGIVLRNYYLIKYFANHVLKFTDTRLVLATGIVFGTVAFKKVEDTSSCLEWYKNLLITNGIEYDEEKQKAINELIEKKKNYNFTDLNKGSIQYFSINNNLPIWFLKMLFKQYGRDIMFKVARECSKMPKQFAYKPTFFEYSDDEKVSLLDFDELDKNFYIYKNEKSIKSVVACHSNVLYPVQQAGHKMALKLPELQNKEITIILHSNENAYVELIDKYISSNNVVEVLYSNSKRSLVPLVKIEKALNNTNFKYHETSDFTLEAYSKNKQDLIVYFAPSSNVDSFRRVPDYILNFSQSSIDDLIKEQIRGLNELAKYVEVNGKLVYCAPTIDIKETEVQVMKFLESNKNFVKEYTELFFPHEKDNSMYYYAILKKVK